jgi:hypothetical protein
MRPLIVYNIEFDLILPDQKDGLRSFIGEVIHFNSNFMASTGNTRDCIIIQPNGFEHLRTLFLSPTLNVYAGGCL